MARDDKKLKELILYIAKKSEADETFGATKLNKILFYTDFLAYQRLGNAITSHPYMKLEQGPAPKYLLPVLEEMIAKNDAARAVRSYHGFKQIRVVALREPNLSVFSPQEVALIDSVMETCCDLSAAQISEMSHRFSGWQLAKLREEIPYFSALKDNREPSPKVLTEAKRLLQVLMKEQQPLAVA